MEVLVSIPNRMLMEFEDFARQRAQELDAKTSTLRKKSPGRSAFQARAAEWLGMAERLLQAQDNA